MCLVWLRVCAFSEQTQGNAEREQGQRVAWSNRATRVKLETSNRSIPQRAARGVGTRALKSLLWQGLENAGGGQY
jgi:hypothetical protein